MKTREPWNVNAPASHAPCSGAGCADCGWTGAESGARAKRIAADVLGLTVASARSEFGRFGPHAFEQCCREAHGECCMFCHGPRAASVHATEPTA